MENTQYAVEMLDICKYFGPVQANNHINIRVKKGEIHAIVGENGAGKTTLMNILYGLLEPSSGKILIEGQPVRITSARKAISLGIGMVHQHFKLVPNFTVAENICLGHEPLNHLFCVDKKKMARHAKEISDRYGLMIDPAKRVCDLSVGLLQRVEILKALSRGAQILILDEPTAVLTPLECKDLFAVLRSMASDGKTVIVITHKLKEVMEIADNITVLRRGETKGTLSKTNTCEHELASLMIGKNADFQPLEKQSLPSAETPLTIQDVWAKDDFGVDKLRGISVQVKTGEIVTIAGVEGNGQTELADVLLGMRRIEHGCISIAGEDVTNKPIRDRRTLCSFIPEDRMTTGLNLQASVHDNLIAVWHLGAQIKRHGFIDYRHTQEWAGDMVNKYSIKCSGLDAEARSMSGGNQQKVVVARELSLGNRVMVVSQPSRGVDIGATRFIHEQLIGQRNAGCAILLVSTDLDEVWSLSDRIEVLYNGEIVASVTPGSVTPEEIGLYMTGAKRMDKRAQAQ